MLAGCDSAVGDRDPLKHNWLSNPPCPITLEDAPELRAMWNPRGSRTLAEWLAEGGAESERLLAPGIPDAMPTEASLAVRAEARKP